ncbi:MAG: outer membrane protein assembly factor BamE [Deltaproteobacteria bacterium]|nr:outer membrane protein assembly factor BamE [Deltaproteobacteria bacterium]
MRRLIFILGPGAVLAMLLGCDTRPRVELLEGRFFEEVRIVALHKGKTTKKDVLDLLGPPWRKTGPPQAEEWEYYARYRRVPAKILGVFSKGRAKVMFRRMTIKFEANVVEHVSHEDSPVDNEKY